MATQADQPTPPDQALHVAPAGLLTTMPMARCHLEGRQVEAEMGEEVAPHRAPIQDLEALRGGSRT